MGKAALERRVDTLEEYMKELSCQSMRTEMELARLGQEMREFKDEMREFKDEMRKFKGEMSAFKDEMLEFKDEMREFKNEAERDRKQMNKRWGEVVNRLGTLVEDIVAPNLPRIAGQLFGCEVETFGIRLIRQIGGRTLEIDALVVCGGRVLINETKSRLTSEHLAVLEEKIQAFPNFFQEYRDKQVFGIAASLHVDDSLVRHATRRGLLVMAMGDETMEVLNPQLMGKDEMREFKDEMREFKNEAERDRKQMNKRWCEVVNRLGTLVEDIVAPNLPRIAGQLFGCEVETFGIRLIRQIGGQTLEIDALVVCGERVLINETKSRLTSEHLAVLEEKIRAFPDFFQEYRNKQVSGIAASLHVDDSLVRHATRRGLLVMAMGDETMEVLNPQLVEPPE